MSNLKLITSKEEALEVLKIDASKLKECSQELRDDEDIIIEAIKRAPIFLDYASSRLKSDKQFALKLFSTKIKGKPHYEFQQILGMFSQELRDDEEVVLKAVSLAPNNFQDASSRLQNDEEFVRKLISINNKMITFQKDGVEYVESNPVFDILFSCSNSLKKNKQFILDMLDVDSISTFIIADSSLKDEEEVVLKAAKLGAGVFNSISDRLSKDREFVIKLLQLNGSLLKEANMQFRSDKVMAIIAITQIKSNIQYHINMFNILITYFHDDRVKNLSSSINKIIDLQKSMLEDVYNSLDESLKIDSDIINLLNFEEENQRKRNFI